MEPGERQQWWGALSAVLSDAASDLKRSEEALESAVALAAQRNIEAITNRFQAKFRVYDTLHGAP